VLLVGFIVRIACNSLPSYTCGLEMKKSYFFARLYVLTAILQKTQSSEDVTFCRFAGISRRLGGV